MADQFVLQGSYSSTPMGQPSSFAQVVQATIDESTILDAQHVDEVTLAVDTSVVVPFGGVANANIIILKAVGGKVTARITSTDGAAQSVPFDTYFILMSESVPVTALDLTRVAGVETTVRVFLGELA
jgi:fructose-specific phosphotransferase system IIC component